MFVLKLEKESGNFVSNLRKTTKILSNDCRVVPKTAFRRSAKCLKPIENISLKQHKMEMEIDADIESEELIILEEPVSRFN
jgi:hypothetical protein